MTVVRVGEWWEARPGTSIIPLVYRPPSTFPTSAIRPPVRDTVRVRSRAGSVSILLARLHKQIVSRRVSDFTVVPPNVLLLPASVRHQPHLRPSFRPPRCPCPSYDEVACIPSHPFPFIIIPTWFFAPMWKAIF